MHATLPAQAGSPQTAASSQAGSAGASTVAQQWAAFVHDTGFRDLSADTVARAKSRLLDALATALAARDLPVPTVARRFVQANRGPATVIGYAEQLPAVDAAFVNATLVNGCTHDDFLAKSHPGAVAIPAALALGEAHGMGGADLLTATVLGYDIVARAYLGSPGMLPAFRGTGVAGAIGAAAAAGKMLALDQRRMVNALGCAAMFAGSTLSATSRPSLVSVAR